MAATLSSTPSSPAYHRDNNLFAIQSDQVVSSPASVGLVISSSGPTIGETLELNWAGITLLFTVAADTTPDALSIPEKGGSETLEAYTLRVIEAFKQNDVLTEDWYVWSGGSAGSIILRHIVGEVLEVTTSSTLTNVAVTPNDGVATQPDNLSAYVQVFQQATDPNADTRLVSLHAPYDISTAQALFDAKDLFDLRAYPPPDSSISDLVGVPHGVDTAGFIAYYLRYADKAGTPAVSEAMLKSQTLYMLRGGKPGDIVNPSLTPAPLRLQHAYLRADGKSFSKPVSIEQPDWTYLFTGSDAITGVHVELQITASDGTTTTEEVPAPYFDLLPRTLYWFASGPRQIANTLPSGLDVVAYNWRLIGDVGSGSELLAQVRYSVNCACHPFEMYLLMDNGMGGLESVYLKGRAKTGYQAERQLARRQRGLGYTVAIGDMLQYNQEGQATFEVNTGWHPRYYIEHLRQILLGELWIIDVPNDRFLKVYCDTKSFDIAEDDQQLFSLSFTLRAAWLDTNIHL